MSVTATTHMNTINHLSTTCKTSNLHLPICFNHRLSQPFHRKPKSFPQSLLKTTLNGSSTHRLAQPVTRRSRFNTRKRLSVSMEWQDCTVKMEVDIPVSVAYNFYLDRESFPKWMPFISSVEVLKDKPDLSRWSLKYNAFGQDIKYSWLARNLQPTPNQKIHWRSLEGLPNKGSVRFFPKGPSSCVVELTVSYEVPALLTPVASALRPFLESLLSGGLERFATLAKTT
ncbi:Polyketide_cyc domain-containing protein [Hirschfeldia incana]|nr:Polyketide_cyc domain-containing protein [Hirschfeldia incana]